MVGGVSRRGGGAVWHGTLLASVLADGTANRLFDRPWTLVLVLLVLLAGLGLIVMRRRVLEALSRFVTQRPTYVLAAGVVLTVLALTTVPFLRISTSRTNLLDEDNPYQKKLLAFLHEFGSPNHLIGVVEGGTAAQRHAAADELARALEARPGLVRFVFYKVDLQELRDKGLLYLPLSELRRLRRLLANPDDPKASERIRRFLQVKSLPDLFRAINQVFEESLEHPDEALKEKGGLKEGLRILEGILEECKRWIRDPRRNKLLVFEQLYFKKFDLSKSNLDEAGYLADRKRKRVFLFIRPASDSDETSVLLPFVQTARKMAARIARKHHVRIGFTGYPALQVDEMETLKRDMFFTTILALLGTLVLFALMFRSARQTALAIATLSTGIIWALGFTVLAYKGLNLITSTFFAILIGLGIDFAIHVISRYNEELARDGDRPAAIRRSILGVGPGLVTGALTTAGAFYATAVTKFTAFSELGVIAGTGLLLVLLGSLTVLPALLAVTKAPERPLEKMNASGAGWAARFVVRWPIAVLLTAGLITVPALVRRPKIPFDYNLTEMLPEGTQSREYYTKMISESNFSSEFISIVADSLSDARELTRRLQKLRTVARVESIATVLPDDQDEKVRILRTMQPIFQSVDVSGPEPPPVTVAEVDRQLEELYDLLDDALEKARRVKRPEAPYLERLLKEVESVRQAIRKVDPNQASQRLTALQAALFQRLRGGIAELKRMLTAKKISPETLPKPIREQFVGKHRRYAVYVYPKKSIWDRAFLGEFVKETRSVDPDATGFPVNYWEHVKMIETGYVEAAFLAGIAILVMLLLDFSREQYVILGIVPMALLAVWSYTMLGWLGGAVFVALGVAGMALFDWRSVAYTFLSVATLALGASWMVAAMGLFKIPYNLANIVALPLILGIGVVYGVHMLHRYREEHDGDVYSVVRHTGGAVTLAALTTMVGFGSLISASHKGAKTMGLTMVIGVLACLIASVLVLPAVLKFVGPRLRREPARSDQSDGGDASGPGSGQEPGE